MASGEARRKEYWARINRAVDYIESHLGEEMTLQDIAVAAYFSPYHFHRIFKSFMGEQGSQLCDSLFFRCGKHEFRIQHQEAGDG
jgi:methylphosphotriester-DNA--protein-cysteine methyltransferase